jgi:hypothetical protein
MSENDPCWRVSIEKRKLAETTDDFERQLIKQQIELFTQRCQEQTQAANPYQRH